MPFDTLMRDGEIFDPDNPRLSHGGPPLIPPDQEDGDGGGRRWPPKNNSDKIIAKLIAFAGYATFAVSGFISGSAEVGVTAVAQTFTAGILYSFFDEPNFANCSLGRFITSQRPQFFTNWEKLSVPRKTFKTTALALCVSIPSAFLFSNSSYRPLGDPSIGDIALKVAKIAPCQVASYFHFKKFESKFCRDSLTLQ